MDNIIMYKNEIKRLAKEIDILTEKIENEINKDKSIGKDDVNYKYFLDDLI